MSSRKYSAAALHLQSPDEAITGNRKRLPRRSLAHRKVSLPQTPGSPDWRTRVEDTPESSASGNIMLFLMVGFIQDLSCKAENPFPNTLTNNANEFTLY